MTKFDPVCAFLSLDPIHKIGLNMRVTAQLSKGRRLRPLWRKGRDKLGWRLALAPFTPNAAPSRELTRLLKIRKLIWNTYAPRIGVGYGVYAQAPLTCHNLKRRGVSASLFTFDSGNARYRL